MRSIIVLTSMITALTGCAGSLSIGAEPNKIAALSMDKHQPITDGITSGAGTFPAGQKCTVAVVMPEQGGVQKLLVLGPPRDCEQFDSISQGKKPDADAGSVGAGAGNKESEDFKISGRQEEFTKNRIVELDNKIKSLEGKLDQAKKDLDNRLVKLEKIPDPPLTR